MSSCDVAVGGRVLAQLLLLLLRSGQPCEPLVIAFLRASADSALFSDYRLVTDSKQDTQLAG